MSLIEAMDADAKERYIPSEEYEEEVRDPLVDISLTEVGDSTELWLIQWPYKQTPNFDGKELSLDLHGNGRLGSFEDSSGKVYDVLSYDSPEPEATVFLTSASEPKIVGKISQRVSLVHYPDPKELEEVNTNNSRKLFATSSGVTLSSAHRFASPVQSNSRRNSQSTREHSSHTHSSRHRSSQTKMGEPSKTPKRRSVDVSNHSTDHSALDSGGRHSGVTSVRSSEHSHEGKSNKKKKVEE